MNNVARGNIYGGQQAGVKESIFISDIFPTLRHRAAPICISDPDSL